MREKTRALDGWMEGRKRGRAGLRIAYSDQKVLLRITFECGMRVSLNVKFLMWIGGKPVLFAVKY